MAENKIQDGDSVTLSAVDVRRLGQLANNSTRLPDARIIQANTSDAVIHQLLDVLSSIPLKGHETVVFTAVVATDDRLGASLIDGDNARCYVSLNVAREWALMASTTINFLGDPEASIVTGYSTSQLTESADLLSDPGWRRN